MKWIIVCVWLILFQAILVTGTGWANAATIDVVYDVLHMMGRDDIAVGLGDSFDLNQFYPNHSNIGDCKYSEAIPHGSGGRLDSDTLYGLARDLPRSPRRLSLLFLYILIVLNPRVKFLYFADIQLRIQSILEHLVTPISHNLDNH